MIGQHPELYGFPELNLFLTETINELLELEATAARHGADLLQCTSGLVRSIAQLELGAQRAADIVAARRLLDARRSWSSAAMLDSLLRRIAPRIGIDKSPRTAMTPFGLDRCLAFDTAARFIHLARNPFDAQRSLQRSLPSPDIDRDGKIIFSALLWYQVHLTILEFTSRLAPGRVLPIMAEAVLDCPEQQCRSIARWLGLQAEGAAVEAMLLPERSQYAFPIFGLDGDNDPVFLSSPARRPSGADLNGAKWSLHAQRLPRRLAAKCTQIATRLGYVAEAAGTSPATPA
jgi:hypothetical protein